MFCLWRLALEYRLHNINQQIVNPKIISKMMSNPKIEDNTINSKDLFRKSILNKNRPMVRNSNAAQNLRIPLRMYEEQDDFKR